MMTYDIILDGDSILSYYDHFKMIYNQIKCKNIVYHTSYRYNYTSKTAKIKNGDNTFAAYRLNVDCCKRFITIFYFCCFRCVIMPLHRVEWLRKQTLLR